MIMLILKISCACIIDLAIILKFIVIDLISEKLDDNNDHMWHRKIQYLLDE